MEVGQPIWIRREADGEWLPAYIAKREQSEGKEGFSLGIKFQDSGADLQVNVKSLTEEMDNLKVNWSYSFILCMFKAPKCE